MITKKLGILTASSLVISSMIGTGVFTSLGFQVVDIKSGFAILFLWLIGGIVAFCGAVCYAELGSVYKRSGGEYNLLRELYHPALGFVAGWVSITVGFAAPASLAAIALASYLSTIIPGLPENHIAAVTILLFGIIHAQSLQLGSRIQNVTTVLKVVLILIFILVGFGVSIPQEVILTPSSQSWTEIASPPFAVALIYVSYAYTGWNSSIYIIGEMKEPNRDLPKSLFLGTLIVMILYLMLNYIFLYTVPISKLAGELEVGFLSGQAIFGELGGVIIAIAISILLLSTVSAYVFLGPRVSKELGEDMRAFRLLAKTNAKGIPINAYIFSTILSLVFIYTSTFEQVLLYTSFLLISITTITVTGIFVLRLKGKIQSDGYKAWGYPFTPVIFILVSLWTLIFVAVQQPFESGVSVGIFLLGIVLYFVTKNKV
ncbi:APC family permease [Reichenbachiella sp.]|uniref:APC family permease n=1 Tax=Reichenbachiella sp. TaxID=2184521 RepID=UPI003B5AB93B